MAKTYTVVCDVTGTAFEPGKDGVEDFEFSWGGTPYLIDLSDAGMDKLSKTLAPVITKARKAPMSQGQFLKASKEWMQRFRAWAEVSGHGDKIPAKGKVPEDLVKVYEKASGDIKPQKNDDE